MARTQVVAIDDDVASNQVLAGQLGDAYEVHVATTGAEGLALARTLKPALLLVSTRLPDMTGFDLQGQAKQDERLRDIPIAFLQQAADTEQEALALDLGAADCLCKPLHPRVLSRRITNVISRETLRKELARREADWLAMLNTIPDLMFRLTRAGTYLSVFARNPELLMVPRRQLIGRSVGDVLTPEATAITLSAIDEAAQEGSSYGHVIELDLPGGHHWFELSVARAGREPDAEQTFILLSRDITRRRLAEQQITHLARYDNLTELPNRGHFIELAEKSIAIAQRSAEGVALLYIDLDKFKPINDLHGHQMGDRVLRLAAQRMQTCLRKADSVGRIGGDEFMILLTGIRSDEDALRVAEKVRTTLEAPMVFDSIPLEISCSVGIALYPVHGHSYHELSHRADMAMYAAKQGGRNAIRSYTELSREG